MTLRTTLAAAMTVQGCALISAESPGDTLLIALSPCSAMPGGGMSSWTSAATSVWSGSAPSTRPPRPFMSGTGDARDDVWPLFCGHLRCLHPG